MKLGCLECLEPLSTPAPPFVTRFELRLRITPHGSVEGGEYVRACVLTPRFLRDPDVQRRDERLILARTDRAPCRASRGTTPSFDLTCELSEPRVLRVRTPDARQRFARENIPVARISKRVAQPLHLCRKRLARTFGQCIREECQRRSQTP